MNGNKIGNLLIGIGVILILIGMTLQLEKLIKDNENKQKIIESQANELIKCNEWSNR